MLGVISFSTLLAVGGFVGFLFATGRLDTARVDAIAAVLRGEDEIVVEAPADPNDPAPVEDANDPNAEEARAPSAEEVRERRDQQLMKALEIERAAADLEARRRLLDHALHEVIQQQEQLTEQRDAFAQQREKIMNAAEDAGFQEEVATVEALAANQAKEHVLRVWEKRQADAVRLLLALDVSKRKRILEQLKTPEELDTLTELLEQIRLQGLRADATDG